MDAALGIFSEGSFSLMTNCRQVCLSIASEIRDVLVASSPGNESQDGRDEGEDSILCR